MHLTKTLGLAFSAAALFGAAATAQAYTLNFDGPGSTAAAFAPAGLTIGYGQYVPNLDSFGDPILGSEHWELDLSAGAVPVIDPSTVGFGIAPSPSKALDVRGGPVLFVFDTPVSLAHFGAILDNSSFGDLDPAQTAVKFYDVSNALLATIGANQTIPGFSISADNIASVKTVLLPSTAFYDNVEIAPVPEPGTLFFGVIGLAAAGCRRTRSRRA